MKKQTNSITILFEALDSVPESRKEDALTATVEYLETIKQMRSGGSSTAEIKAAENRIWEKYNALI